MNVHEALDTLRRAGKGILIVDVPKKNYTRQNICDRWSKSSTWFDELLKDPACLLKIDKKGGRGRGNVTTWKGHSVIQEEMRLKNLLKL